MLATAITGALGKSATVDTYLHKRQLEPAQPSQVPKHGEGRILYPSPACHNACRDSPFACSQNSPLSSLDPAVAWAAKKRLAGTFPWTVLWHNPDANVRRHQRRPVPREGDGPSLLLGLEYPRCAGDGATTCSGRPHGALRYRRSRDYLLLRRLQLLGGVSRRGRGWTVPWGEYGPGRHRMKPAIGHLLRGGRGRRGVRIRTGPAWPSVRSTRRQARDGAYRSRDIGVGRHRLKRHACTTAFSSCFAGTLTSRIQPRHPVQFQRPIPAKDHSMPGIAQATSTAADQDSGRQHEDCLP